MEIKQISLTDKGRANRDYSDILVLEIDGKVEFAVYDGEPEDSNLSRCFNDCYKMFNLLKMVYEAGVRQEGFNFTPIKVDEYEF